MFPSFELFGREVGSYGVMTALGLLACLLVGSQLIKRFDIDLFDFVLLMIAIVAGLAVGAVIVYGISNAHIILYTLTHLSELGWSGAWQMLFIAFGGMVFYGGFIGGGIGLLIYTKFNKTMRPHRDGLLDIYGVTTPLFHAFGRVGCFLGGCCYGIESEFGFTVHGNELNPSINDVNRFPVQLVESGCNLIIFGILLYLFIRRIMEKRLIYIYMLIYPVVRFSLEFLRGDTYRGFLLGLSTSQWISICLFVFALIMLPIKNRKLRQQKTQETTQEAAPAE